MGDRGHFSTMWNATRRFLVLPMSVVLVTPSLSRSASMHAAHGAGAGGGAQPLVEGSFAFGPTTRGQASSASRMPSPSVSLGAGGAQPFVFLSSVFGPAIFGHAIAHLDPPFRAYVSAQRARYYASRLPPYRKIHEQNVIVAPIVVLEFLDAHAAQYDVMLARAETSGGVHIIAIRRAWPAYDRVVGELYRAEERVDARAPYLRVARLARKNR